MHPGGGTSNPGSGATLQLAAVGLQDLEMRGSFTPFAIAYRRATRFAAWTEDFGMDYTPGRRSQVDIPKSGDMLGDMYLQITLPAVASAPPGATWCPLVGYTLLRRVRLLLNDQEIHNFERLWYDIQDSLYTSAGHARGLDSMVGRTPLPMAVGHILHVPLKMLTCRPGASRAGLPLQAIPRALLRLDVDWELPATLSAHTPTDPGISVRLLADYAELEEPEKTRLLRGTTLAFESAIDSDALSYYIDSDGVVKDLPALKVNLGNVRFAVKALAWVAYEETGQPLFTYLQRPLRRAFVSFNNQDRFFEREAEYFDTLQKYQHCARCVPGAPPSVYSFAFDATSRYPSGVADFGALSQASLQGTISAGVPRFKLKVFSIYYNFLEIGGASAKVVFV